MALDTAQNAAASTDAARVLVLAGAGSGKTRTLVHRIIYLVKERAQAPERILVATFTQRAAQEIRARLTKHLGRRARALRAGTFHALALRYLRKYSKILGLRPDFTILGRQERHTLLGEAIQAVGIDPRGKPGVSASHYSRLLSRAENEERPLTDILSEWAPELLTMAESLESAADHYARSKAQVGGLDYDDLLVLWRLLLDPVRPTALQIGGVLDHVLVDEYQDTTPVQAALAEDLTASGAALFVVGDDAQSIYGFRGARFDNILEFPTLAPTEVHRLTTSYRSAPAVIALARASLELNPLQFPKPLTSALPAGEPVRLITADDEVDEARRVSALARRWAEDDTPYPEQAILVRRHRDALAFEIALAEAGVPYVVRTGGRFIDRPHIADALAYARIVLRSDDMLAWRRVLALRPGIGPVTVRRLSDYLQPGIEGGESPVTLLRQAHERISLPARARDGCRSLAGLLDRLTPLVSERPSAFFSALTSLEDPGLEASLARTEEPDAAREDLLRLTQIRREDLQSTLDGLEGTGVSDGDESDGLTISTVHAAKGLEWRAVFLVGLSDGNFPLQAALREADGESEERRLFYVAVTRAARRLALTWPASRRNARGSYPTSLSRFIQELPSQLYSSDSLK